MRGCFGDWTSVPNLADAGKAAPTAVVLPYRGGHEMSKRSSAATPSLTSRHMQQCARLQLKVSTEGMVRWPQNAGNRQRSINGSGLISEVAGLA
jgi:hypothetical protein